MMALMAKNVEIHNSGPIVNKTIDLIVARAAPNSHDVFCFFPSRELPHFHSNSFPGPLY
jgi:hypothetical protein